VGKPPKKSSSARFGFVWNFGGAQKVFFLEIWGMEFLVKIWFGFPKEVLWGLGEKLPGDNSLGLWTLQLFNKIFILHKGRLEIESREHIGSLFSFKL